MKIISEGLLIYISRSWEVNLFLIFFPKSTVSIMNGIVQKKLLEWLAPWAECTIDHLSKGLWKLEKNVRKHLWMMEPRIIWKVIKIGAGNSTHFFVQNDKLCKWLCNWMGYFLNVATLLSNDSDFHNSDGLDPCSTQHVSNPFFSWLLVPPSITITKPSKQ